MRVCLLGLLLVLVGLAAMVHAQPLPLPVPPKPVPGAASVPGTYTDRATLATQPPFIGRVGIASQNTTAMVLKEATNTPNHANRYALAQMVLKEPEFLARRLAPMMAANIPVTSTDHDNNPATPPIIDTTWTDEQIQGLMDQQWNLLANALVPPPASTVLTPGPPK